MAITMLLLGGCANTPWPKWITGEPTVEELAVYQGPIEMPSTNTQGKNYPNLADVPERPTLFSSAQQSQDTVNELQAKNEEAQKILEEFKKQMVAKPAAKIKPKKNKSVKNKKTKKKKEQ